ncbi:hypothetical protein FB00_11190 [Cellulosimicrobium funkei]|uniref:DUF2188 domain-containing protein n=1 Tax=Cellulosimicrobium funkei TaxID=264251 RepID=A0A0H2KM13_9MICO|nr:DUF2188 domain-containing protein [Cellulosimicrobium funkei]KLN34565.1 hypothetical protein FB00_11190 [Cellulosimicrobium funkei]
MAKGDVHTSYDDERGQWVNRREGASRISSAHDRADDASARGQDLARSTGSEWVKHRKDNGQIHDRNSYGDDPFPPRG